MQATVTRSSFQSDEGVEAAEAALRRVFAGAPSPTKAASSSAGASNPDDH